MAWVRMRQDVLNEIISVLIACNLNGGQQRRDGLFQGTYYRSMVYEDDLPALHRHARDSAQENQCHQF